MRIVFMGAPDFAEASLKNLLDEGFEVVGVFTQPDRPRGRGMATSCSPVKELALARGLPVFQPEKLRDGTALSILRELRPDLLVVVAYGKLLPDDILALPKYGAINVHASLLPKYRGAAPIQWAVLNGDRTTGVSIMYLAHDMDSGDVIEAQETEIGEKETSGELFERLKIMGAELLIKALREIGNGTASRRPQDHSRASYVSMLDKSMSPIRWDRPARLVMKQIFGLQPWPVATAELGGKRFKIYTARRTDAHTGKAPGSILGLTKTGLQIACGDGNVLEITRLQAEGGKRMAAPDYFRGHPLPETP